MHTSSNKFLQWQGVKGGFWLFGRKSVDQGYLKDGGGFGTLQKLPRRFSFEELNGTTLTSSAAVRLKKQSYGLSIDSSTVKMQRGESQGSLASSTFRYITASTTR